MDREELLSEWEQNNHRPAYVREHREAIHAHTDLNEPIPDGSLAQVRRWLDSYKGTVTRQLRAEDDESGESDMADDTEGDA